MAECFVSQTGGSKFSDSYTAVRVKITASQTVKTTKWATMWSYALPAEKNPRDITVVVSQTSEWGYSGGIVFHENDFGESGKRDISDNIECYVKLDPYWFTVHFRAKTNNVSTPAGVILLANTD